MVKFFMEVENFSIVNGLQLYCLSLSSFHRPNMTEFDKDVKLQVIHPFSKRNRNIRLPLIKCNELDYAFILLDQYRFLQLFQNGCRFLDCFERKTTSYNQLNIVQ